jgi:hypothetical protein
MGLKGLVAKTNWLAINRQSQSNSGSASDSEVGSELVCFRETDMGQGSSVCVQEFIVERKTLVVQQGTERVADSQWL